MGKTHTKADNSKKAAGNARKAVAADKKQQELNAKVEAAETEEWSKGAKSSAKKELAEAKKAEAATKKAQRDAELALEEANLKTVKTSKQAQKKNTSKGLDLSQLDEKLSDINATGIDNALDALTLTGSSAATDASKIDRHPERRFKAAYAAFEAKRLPELQKEHPGLRLTQRQAEARKEFEKHPDNPFNQASGRFDSTGAELQDIAAGERARKEKMLSS